MYPKPRPKLDKRNLWPWCEWMTIGIGVLATDPSLNSARPNRIVLMADTMGSFGDIYSHPRLHKMFVSDGIGLYATAADRIDRAAELFDMIEQPLSLMPAHQRTYGEILKTIAVNCFLYKKERFTLDELPKFRLAPHDFDPKTALTPALDAKLSEAWRDYYIGCDMLIGAFDPDGRAHLFYVNGQDGTVDNLSFPGFGAIGVPDNAMFWLSNRRQVMGMGLKRSAYHAYEAKLMAEKSAHVNDHIDMLIAGKGEKSWFVSTHRPELGVGSPVSLPDLKRWHEEYGPRNTEGLDT
jgi:hypothetical protein